MQPRSATYTRKIPNGDSTELTRLIKESVAAPSAYSNDAAAFAISVSLFICIAVLVADRTGSPRKRGLFADSVQSGHFAGTFIVGIPVIAFVKDSLRWGVYIRSGHAARATAAAAQRWARIACCLMLQGSFSPEGPEQALVVSGFPLGF